MSDAPPTDHPSDTDHASDEAEAWLFANVAERQTWLAFLAVVMRVIPQLDAHHKRRFGVSHLEYTILIMLADSEGHTSELSSLARRSNASLSRMSHVVRRLRSDGLVSLAKSTKDARATAATLTPEGAKLLQEAAPANMDEVRRLIFDPLSSEQQQQLNAICLTLLQSWQPDDPHPWII